MEYGIAKYFKALNQLYTNSLTKSNRCHKKVTKQTTWVTKIPLFECFILILKVLEKNDVYLFKSKVAT